MFGFLVRLQRYPLPEALPAHFTPVRRLVGVLPPVRLHSVAARKFAVAEFANVRPQLEVRHLDVGV
jgi:hypothetical protein